MANRKITTYLATIKWLSRHRDEHTLPFVSPDADVLLQAFSCERGDTRFFFAFAVGDGLRYTPIGSAAVNRAGLHSGTKTATVVLIENLDRAYERVSAILTEIDPPSSF